MASDYEIDEDSIEDYWRDDSSNEGEEKKDAFGRNKDELHQLASDLESKVVGFLHDHHDDDVDEDKLKNAALFGDETTITTTTTVTLPIHKPHAYPCQNSFEELPPPPSQWPQAPVMLRPTPGSNTKIRGMRYVHDTDYQTFPGFCNGCVLPINNGKELAGDSVVIDFESDHFVGTLLIRLKDIPSFDKKDNTSSTSYFDGRRRRFQAIVKGKFKTQLKMSQCLTGQIMNRPAGKMPPKWMIKSFIKFITVLAPQLEVEMDSAQPKALAPLVATAHTVMAKPHENNSKEENGPEEDTNNDEKLQNYNIYQGSLDMEENVEEPPATDSVSLMQDVHEQCHMALPKNEASSVASRMKARKKAYNLVKANHMDHPKFSLEKEYTFEFYQHLLMFDGKELVLDMGSMMGKHALASYTNGQPLKCNAIHRNYETNQLEYIWSFDIWHESLFPYAKAALSK